jgi:hypothetical protein
MEEHEMENFFNRMNEKKRNIDFALLKQTLKRGNSMPLSVNEFEDLFGKIREDDLEDLTYQFISTMNGIEDNEWTHILGMENPSEYDKDEMKAWIVDGWGEDWVKEILIYNQDKENYEDCARIFEALQHYTNLENFVNKNGVK